MKIAHVIFPFILLLSLAACASPQTTTGTQTSDLYIAYYKADAGKVEISCGDMKITPYDNFISSYEQTPEGWLSGDGIRFEFSPKSIKTGQFQTLDYTDGVDVSITGNSDYSAYYILYRDDLTKIGENDLDSGETRLMLPEEAGTYIVDLIISWRAGSNPAKETREYLFKARYSPSTASDPPPQTALVNP